MNNIILIRRGFSQSMYFRLCFCLLVCIWAFQVCVGCVYELIHVRARARVCVFATEVTQVIAGEMTAGEAELLDD